MLSAVLQNHLKQHTSTVSQDMLDNLYMDNILSSCDTEQEAGRYYNELRSILSSANFNLRSWSSNSMKLKDIAVQENTSDDNTLVNILGLCWNPTMDKICIISSEVCHSNQW